MFETPNHDRQKAIFAKGSIDTAEHFSQCVNAVCKYIKLSEKPNLKAETLDMSRYLRLDSSAQLNLHLDSNVQNESTIAKFGFRYKKQILFYRIFQLLLTRKQLLSSGCTTPQGRRVVRRWLSQPLTSLTDITDRQNSVQFFIENETVRGNLSDR